jgi:hypothetical protein
MNLVQYLSKVNLRRVKEHHRRVLGVLRHSECEVAFREIDPTLSSGDTTGGKIQLGENVTIIC